MDILYGEIGWGEGSFSFTCLVLRSILKDLVPNHDECEKTLEQLAREKKWTYITTVAGAISTVWVEGRGDWKDQKRSPHLTHQCESGRRTLKVPDSGSGSRFCIEADKEPSKFNKRSGCLN